MSRDTFTCYKRGEEYYWRLVGRSQEAPRHPARPRTASPTTKKYLTHNVTSAKVEKFWSNPRWFTKEETMTQRDRWLAQGHTTDWWQRWDEKCPEAFYIVLFRSQAADQPKGCLLQDGWVKWKRLCWPNHPGKPNTIMQGQVGHAYCSSIWMRPWLSSQWRFQKTRYQGLEHQVPTRGLCCPPYTHFSF